MTATLAEPFAINLSRFFAVASETMRRILVDRARCRLSQKRGGDYQRTEVDLVELPNATDDALFAGP